MSMGDPLQVRASDCVSQKAEGVHGRHCAVEDCEEGGDVGGLLLKVHCRLRSKKQIHALHVI